ncbi:MAG: hypothetical protein NT165_01930 [Candidatus Falkowbacteria bacterium]|nr:hypothetical protein [Candidatus Falkowbacteria bacterium]
MKKFLIPSLKLGLALLFLFNIGFFSLFNNLGNEVSPPIKQDGGRGDVQYLNEKVRRAQNLGDNYGPEEYFSDLTEIKIKQKKNDFDRFAIMSVQHSINSMLEVFNRNVQRKHASSDEEYDKFMERLSVARTKLEKTIDPDAYQKNLLSEKEMHRSGYWSGVLMSLLLWLFNFWWQKMPFAFILLYIWRYQEQETLWIKNPLSFLICLAIYPIVIIRVWLKIFQQETRKLAMKIEFKRREINIFSLISNDELSDIRLFAKSNIKLSEYRDYLDNRGLIRRHYFLPVAMVTMLIVLIPRTVSCGDNFHHQDDSKCQIMTKAPPGDLVQKCFDGGVSSLVSATIEKQDFYHFSSVVWQMLLPPPQKERKGFKTNPDPIPLFV